MSKVVLSDSQLSEIMVKGRDWAQKKYEAKRATVSHWRVEELGINPTVCVIFVGVRAALYDGTTVRDEYRETL